MQKNYIDAPLLKHVPLFESTWYNVSIKYEFNAP